MYAQLHFVFNRVLVKYRLAIHSFVFHYVLIASRVDTHPQRKYPASLNKKASIWALAHRPWNGIAAMRAFQGMDANNFTANNVFIDHTIEDEIYHWKTKQNKYVFW